MSSTNKAERIEEAVRLGFIKRTKGLDGLYTYELTRAGFERWMIEDEKAARR